MSKPQFSFLANNHSPEDESGVATWKMGELVVRQYFVNFRQARTIDALLEAAYAAGRADAASEIAPRLQSILKEFPR